MKTFRALTRRFGPGFHQDKFQPEPKGFGFPISPGFRFSPE